MSKAWDVIGDDECHCEQCTSCMARYAPITRDTPVEDIMFDYAPTTTPFVKRGENPKDRIGVTKPSLHLVPPAAMIREAKVFELGAAKYGPYNWRDNAVKSTVYVSAALRHIMSYLDGEDVDPESDQSHLAHARACMGILIDAMDTGNLVDDRPKKGVAAELIRSLTPKKEAA